MPDATRQLETLVFDSYDARDANKSWGCNCGPSALAFALGMTLSEVRPFMGEFETKRYTNPKLMIESIRRAGAKITKSHRVGREFSGRFPIVNALCRIQWAGPWTEPGAPPKWAYRQTHWVYSMPSNRYFDVFDVNCGIVGFEEWRDVTVPVILAGYPKASGEWYPTHAFELEADT